MKSDTGCMVKDWVVFGPGHHKGDLYTPADIDRIVENFSRLKGHVTPIAKLGHDRQQRLSQSLGFINAGEITSVSKTPEGNLKVTVVGVPKSVAEQINAGRLNSGSIEILPRIADPRDAAKSIEGPILTAVAFLGEEQPAVKGMAPPRAVFPDGREVPPAADAPEWLRQMGAVVQFSVPSSSRREWIGGRELPVTCIAFSEMCFSSPPKGAKSMSTKLNDSELDAQLQKLGLTNEQIAKVKAMITGSGQMSHDDDVTNGITSDNPQNAVKKLADEIRQDEESLTKKKFQMGELMKKALPHPTGGPSDATTMSQGPIGAHLNENGRALIAALRVTYPNVFEGQTQAASRSVKHFADEPIGGPRLTTESGLAMAEGLRVSNPNTYRRLTGRDPVTGQPA